MINMIKLKPEKYHIVLPLIEKVNFNKLFALSVVKNMVRGRIFVDNSSSPGTCLIAHKYGNSLLCGNTENNQFNKKLLSYFANEKINNDFTKKILVYPKIWNKKLKELLGEYLKFTSESHSNIKNPFVFKKERLNFIYPRNFIPIMPDLNKGLMLKRIDKILFKKIKGSISPVKYWNNADDFLFNGAGFCLIKDNKIASYCFSAYVIGSKMEFAIETNISYRNMGYSIYPLSAMVNYCLTSGFEPVWACMKDNTASVKIAQKIGFIHETTIPAYMIPQKKEQA